MLLNDEQKMRQKNFRTFVKIARQNIIKNREGTVKAPSKNSPIKQNPNKYMRYDDFDRSCLSEFKKYILRTSDIKKFGKKYMLWNDIEGALKVCIRNVDISTQC